MNIFKRNYIMSELLKLWLNDKKKVIKEQSLVKYNNLINCYILPYLGNVNYKTINEKDIKKYFENNNISKLSLSTQRALLFIIKSSINYAISNNLRKQINFSNINIKRPKPKVVYFTRNEQDILEEYLKNNINIDKIGILICLYSGIRLGEVCGLKWEDIDFINKTISINKTVQRIKNDDINSIHKTKKIISSPKSNSSLRTIPIPDYIIELLKNFRSNNNYYVLTNNIYFKDTRIYERFFENILLKNNIRKLNFHSLRHTFATRCIESGMDVKTLSEILGHSSYQITLDVYVHSTLDQKRACMNNLVKYINNVVE